jgi:hypothetical protein
VLGVLLLNTAMQQQADRIALQQQHISSLEARQQTLQTRLDWAADPARLAARARRLHLRPVLSMRYVGLTAARTSVSGRSRATGRAHAG